MMVHPCDPSTRAVETGESRVQDRPQLHTELKASLDYMRLSIQTLAPAMTAGLTQERSLEGQQDLSQQKPKRWPDS